MTESSINTVILFAAWSIIGMIFGVPAASLCWAVLILIAIIGVVASANVRDQVKRELETRTTPDKLVSWFILIFALVSTYPFTSVFWGFLTVVVCGEVAIRLALKISCK